MAWKRRPAGGRFAERGLRETCQDCGMRIEPSQPRFRHVTTEQTIHAFTEHCIEGHGDSERRQRPPAARQGAGSEGAG